MGTLANCRDCGETHEIESTRLNDAYGAAGAVVSGLLADAPHIRGTYGGWYFHIRMTDAECLYLCFYREQSGQTVLWDLVRILKSGTAQGFQRKGMPVPCPWRQSGELALRQEMDAAVL